MNTYSMHSVHLDFDGANGLVFKAKEGFEKVKLVVSMTVKEIEMDLKDFDLFLSELEILRDKMRCG